MLPVHILKEIADKQMVTSVGRGVALSFFKDAFGIPSSTFYRAIRLLIDQGLIVRIKRDEYMISYNFVALCAHGRMRTYGETF